MTSRERVRAALRHLEADKIPIDCGGMRSTGMLGSTYNRLKRYLGIGGGSTKIYDMVQQLALVEDWYLDRFQIDIVDLARVFAENPQDWNEWTLPDGSMCKVPAWLKLKKRGTSWFVVDSDGEELAEMPEGSYFFDQKIWPYFGKDVEDTDTLAKRLNKIMWVYMTDPMWKNAGDPDFYDRVHAEAKRLYDHTNRSIMVGFGGQFFELGCYIFRNDEFMVNMLTKPAMTERVLDKLLEIHTSNLTKLLAAIDPFADVIVFGDDLGTQNGPMLSPDLYRKMILPRAAQLYHLVREKTDIKVFLHSCGGIYPFLADLIEAGIQVINPVQTSAMGMEPQKLKREFGKDLVFWGGGIDTQHTLPEATPDAVRIQVHKNCEIFMPGGGFVFNQIHNILDSVPPENIVAMYEAVNDMRY